MRREIEHLPQHAHFRDLIDLGFRTRRMVWVQSGWAPPAEFLAPSVIEIMARRIDAWLCAITAAYMLAGLELLRLSAVNQFGCPVSHDALCHAPSRKIVAGEKDDIRILWPVNTPWRAVHCALEPSLVRELASVPRLARVVVVVELRHADAPILHVDGAALEDHHDCAEAVEDRTQEQCSCPSLAARPPADKYILVA